MILKTQALEKVPDYLNSLFTCLLAWREAAIGFTGDISKMFNQIEMYPVDQKYHRFLWRDGQENADPKGYQWLRIPFGDKSSPDLVDYCVKVVAERNKEEYPNA